MQFSGAERMVSQIVFRVMGPAAPWGQSLLRSCLAAHSFPPPPPHEVALRAILLARSDVREGADLRDRTFAGAKTSTPHAYAPIAGGKSASTEVLKRGVAAGRSAQRGTSGATTGGGGRSAPDP